MDKVQKPSNIECYSPLSETLRICYLLCLVFPESRYWDVCHLGVFIQAHFSTNTVFTVCCTRIFTNRFLVAASNNGEMTQLLDQPLSCLLSPPLTTNRLVSSLYSLGMDSIEYTTITVLLWLHIHCRGCVCIELLPSTGCLLQSSQYCSLGFHTMDLMWLSLLGLGHVE
jgi:hypothetical protein